jgi:hypothetical protein
MTVLRSNESSQSLYFRSSEAVEAMNTDGEIRKNDDVMDDTEVAAREFLFGVDAHSLTGVNDPISTRPCLLPRDLPPQGEIKPMPFHELNCRKTTNMNTYYTMLHLPESFCLLGLRSQLFLSLLTSSCPVCASTACLSCTAAKTNSNSRHESTIRL